jgi:hypothetical protein
MASGLTRMAAAYSAGSPAIMIDANRTDRDQLLQPGLEAQVVVAKFILKAASGSRHPLRCVEIKFLAE